MVSYGRARYCLAVGCQGKCQCGHLGVLVKEKCFAGTQSLFGVQRMSVLLWVCCCLVVGWQRVCLCGHFVVLVQARGCFSGAHNLLGTWRVGGLLGVPAQQPPLVSLREPVLPAATGEVTCLPTAITVSTCVTNLSLSAYLTSFSPSCR